MRFRALFQDISLLNGSVNFESPPDPTANREDFKSTRLFGKGEFCRGFDGLVWGF